MKRLLTILIIVLLTCLIFVGCTDANKTETGITVSVLNKGTLTIRQKDLEGIDFTLYFVIFEKGENVEVLDGYIDKSALPSKAGKGSVTLEYKGEKATLNVEILKDEIEITKTQESITLDTKQITTFDFTSLFTIKVNGESVEVLDSYIDKTSFPILPGFDGCVTLNYGDSSASIEIILTQAEKEVIITAEKDTLSVWDEEFSTQKYTSLFSITVDGRYVTVMNAYVKVSDVENNKATITCSYMGKEKTIEVNVLKTQYEITLESESIEVNMTIAKDYDYLSLFKATRNGEEYVLSSEMVETNVSDSLGNYTYTVTVGTLDSNKVSKTLNVNVVFAHMINAVNCYNYIQIPKNELDYFDFTTLFALYVDGVAVEVKADMIDLSNLVNAVEGETYSVELVYALDEDTFRQSAEINVVESIDIVIFGENVSVDLHSTAYDLTKLFTIKRGEEEIPVSLEMISGEVNYVKAGEYTLTCSYGDKTGTATITVTDGVIINHRYGEKIYILKGTNQNSYFFGNDFQVTINGLPFTNLESCIDSSSVDFSKVGEYEAELTIKYNTKALSLSSVKFDVFTSKVSYVVIDTVYSITKPEDVLILPKGTNSFNVLSQLKVEINNRKQALTQDPNAISVIACYVEILSDDIDFNSPAYQEVSIAVYVYGKEKEPVIVKYFVCIESDIQIKTLDRIVFEGDTLYTKDLFVITENGKEINVDNSMINGKVNTFVSGIYKVSVEYKGIYAETQVVVCSNNLKGEYFTPLMTIPKETETDEDDQIIVEGTSAKPIGDLILTESGLTVNGTTASDIKFVDANTMTFMLGTNDYTLHFDNGVIVLDPNNSLKLSFSDYRRPYIYFNKALWELKSSLTVNSSSSHILQNVIIGYSIDIFTLVNKTSGEEKSIGLKIHLVSKTAADTIYQVTWGEAVYSESFEQKEGELGKVTFLDEEYTFTMQSEKVAKVNLKESMDKLLANKSFNGVYEGGNAVLSINNMGHYAMYVNGVLRFSVGSYELSSEIKYGGYDPVDNTVLLFKYLETNEKNPCFSVKVTLDLENGTFEVLEKTQLWGLFTMDNKYIFLDGYGKGFVNYNTASSYVYKFQYQINSGILTIKYLDTDVTFPYGTSATFAIESFNNVLRIQEFYDNSYIGQTLENKHITDGAIIRIISAVVGKNKTAADAKNEFEKNVVIITKDGELTGSAKSACFDYKFVRFSMAGFYKFAIKVSVGGEELQADYVLQVLDSIYEENPLVGVYGYSILKEGYSLTLDKWGRIYLKTANGTYESSYKIVGNEYFATFSGIGYNFTLSGKLVENGLITLTTKGSLLLNDYFTTGFSYVCGNDDKALRKIVIGDTNLFYFSDSVSVLGNSVEVSVISGTLNSNDSILRITESEGKTTVVRVNEWENKTKGLTLADSVYGSYANSGSTMTLNGFGDVTINGLSGTYTINSNKTVTVTIGETISFYALNFEEKTYAPSTMVVDNSILENKILSSTYMFSYEDTMCSATTTFQFIEGGKVIVTSVSDDFYENAGTSYKPEYLSKDGENTTYSVNKNKLTITVNSYTFVFLIKDVSKPNEIVLIESNYPDSGIGRFPIGQVFGN